MTLIEAIIYLRDVEKFCIEDIEIILMMDKWENKLK